jgi:hypothetical protein
VTLVVSFVEIYCDRVRDLSREYVKFYQNGIKLDDVQRQFLH